MVVFSRLVCNDFHGMLLFTILAGQHLKVNIMTDYGH